MPHNPREEHELSQPDYKPTARERAALQAFREHRSANPAPRLKVPKTERGRSTLVDHPNQTIGQCLIMEAIGTMDADFTQALMYQIANATSSQYGKFVEDDLNFMLSVIKSVKPKEQLEAMLAAHMGAVHLAIMTLAKRLAHAEDIPHQDSAERAFNKLARTFAMQMEALKRYRTGCEQNVTVQHVSVSEGGQAIVGNVTQNSAEAAPKKTTVAASPALADSGTAAMTVLEDKERAPLPAQRVSKK